MTPIDAGPLLRLLGMQKSRAERILAGDGVSYEVSRCDAPSPQGYPTGPESRVFWAECRDGGSGVILHLALPQVESDSVQAARERHFGAKADPVDS